MSEDQSTKAAFEKELAERLPSIEPSTDLIEYLKSEQARCTFVGAGASGGLFLSLANADFVLDQGAVGLQWMLIACIVLYALAAIACLLAYGVPTGLRQQARMRIAMGMSGPMDCREVPSAGGFTMIAALIMIVAYAMLLGIFVWILWP